MRVFLTFIVIVADAAIHGCVFRWLLVGFRVGVFVACELFSSPLPVVIGYELLSCLRQQESNQRNAASLQVILVLTTVRK